MNSNRCPDCGGTASHLVTDIIGRVYRRCMTGLTAFRREGNELTRLSFIRPCDTIIDDRGRKFTGTIAYAVGEDKLETLAVTDGKVRR